jgi:hypothetical protein
MFKEYIKCCLILRVYKVLFYIQNVEEAPAKSRQNASYFRHACPYEFINSNPSGRILITVLKYVDKNPYVIKIVQKYRELEHLSAFCY